MSDSPFEPHRRVSPDDFAYPFPVPALAPTRLPYARRLVAQLDSVYGLFLHEPGILQSVAMFAHYCSPRDAEGNDFEAAALFLYAFTYLNGAGADPSFPEQVDTYWTGLSGCTFARHGGALTQAGSDLRRRLLGHGEIPEHIGFLQALWSTLAACRWESRHAHDWPVDITQYLVLRQHTIAVQPFLELWKVVGGFLRRDQMEVAARIEHVDSLSRHAQLLANDLCSEHIDTASGQQNSVCMLMRRDGVSVDEARRRLRQRHDDVVFQLALEIDDLRRLRAPPAKLHWYLDLVQSCTRGNTEAMSLLRDRYGEPEPASATQQGCRVLRRIDL